MPELWELYDGNKRPTGKTLLRGQQIPNGFWHIIVDVWTIAADGRLLLTRRHPDKTWPLLWEGTAGSVLAGESSMDGAKRELREETGLVAEEGQITLLSSEKADRFFFDNYLYLCPRTDPELSLQPGEVSEARFVDIRELDEWKDRFCPPAWDRLNHDRAAIERAAEQCRLKYLTIRTE